MRINMKGIDMKVRLPITLSRFFVIALLGAMLAAASGCGQKEAAGNGRAETIPVTVARAAKADISAKTTVTGKVAPLEEVVIVPKIAGKVVQVPVDVGTRVRKGALLVKLDTTDLEISLSAALNGLQNARLTHDQAVLNYNNAKANYDRMKTLYNEGAVSKQQLEQAELAFNLARDAVNAPAVASAQNQIDNIRNQIANATITSPIDGEVSVRNVDPGEMAGPTQPVMTVVNIDRVLVEGTVAESDIALVKPGQKVSVKVDAAGGMFEGTIKTLSPVANPQTKGYPVKVEIPNSGHRLKPGMFAEIQLVTKEKDSVIVVPKEALVSRGAEKVIYVVKGDTAEERQVQTGIEADDRIEITKGLSEGEMFVIEGQQSLFDKAKVAARAGTGS